MCLMTSWKKMLKIVLSSVLSVLYVGLLVFILMLEPSYNTSGVSLPFGSNQGYSEMNSAASGKQKKDQEITDSNGKNKKSDEISEEIEPEKLPRSIKKKSNGQNGRLIYTLLFFFFIILLIIWQNLRSKGKGGYENPYVDTNQYKLPLEDDAKMPIVHYLHLKLQTGERIYFATETVKKGEEGNFIVTDRRVIIKTLGDSTEFELKNLEAVTSASDSVMLLTSGDRKYYIFMPEGQLKYALAIIRWAFKKIS